MSVSRSWLKRAQRALASHVDRLQETLVVLTERLRETVAQAVSNSLAGAIREAVHALFSDTEPSRAPPSFSQRSPYRPPSTWGEPDRYDREEEERERSREDWSSDRSQGWREVECDLPSAPEDAGFAATPCPLARCPGGWLPDGGLVAAPPGDTRLRGCRPRHRFAGHRCRVRGRHRVGRIRPESVEPGRRPALRRPGPGLLVVIPNLPDGR